MNKIEKSPDVVNMVTFVMCSCFTKYSALSGRKDLEPIQFFGKAMSQAQLKENMDTQLKDMEYVTLGLLNTVTLEFP